MTQDRPTPETDALLESGMEYPAVVKKLRDLERRLAEAEEMLIESDEKILATLDVCAALRTRLEIDGAYDIKGNKVPFPSGAPDGISCRDETIRQQDEQIAALSAERDRLRRTSMTDLEIAAAVARALGLFDKSVYWEQERCGETLQKDGSNVFDAYWFQRCVLWLSDQGYFGFWEGMIGMDIDPPKCPVSEFPARAIAELMKDNNGSL